MINIMYISDDNYAEIMGVSILSLLESNPDEKLRFYIVNDNISDHNLERIRRVIEENGAEAMFLPKPDIKNLLGTDIHTARWGDNIFARLFPRELFGNLPEIEKILYLDCDTLVTGRISELWETNISAYLGAACMDSVSDFHKFIIGQKKDGVYFNSGVILLNVRRWIEENIQDEIVRYVREKKGRLEYPDQAVINANLSGRFLTLDPKYNAMTIGYDLRYNDIIIYRKPRVFYNQTEWEAAIQNPVIVHFTTSFLSLRPWFEGSHHPYAKKWKEIHDRSPWKDKPYRILKNRGRKEKIIQIYRALPNWFSVRVAGIAHAYLKPMAFALRG